MVGVRLFVAVWPPPAVVTALEALERRALAGVRWTTAQQWHVTLRFLGAVEDPDAVVRRLAAARLPPARAVAGPAARRLGSSVWCLPVNGLDEVAAGVVAATEGIGVVPDDRAFRGHLTLARFRSPKAVFPFLVLDATWAVGEVTVVASTLGGTGSAYDVVGRVPLGPALPGPGA